ncbi:MAG: HD domain-containing protein [Ignavibacteria bacterium]|nr:HD domain-containing protein [Ignavibacteria bacterium]
MNLSDKSIAEVASDFVFELFKNKLPSHYIYHNYRHTEEVAEAARKIAGKMNLSEEDTEIVTLAAWFHDTGFIERSQNHEDASIEIAKKFLSEHNYSNEKTEKIIGCINATRYPQSPKNILEEIIADADLFHIGTKDYNGRSDLLRIEWEKAANKNYTDLEWLKINTDFLAGHKFYTRYAKKTLDESKAETLVKLQKQFRKKSDKEKNSEKKRQELISEKIALKEELKDKTGSGISSDANAENIKKSELFLRNAVSYSIQTNGLADRKAINMLSINSVLFIISGFLSLFITKYDTDNMLLIPMLILLMTSVVCLLFSVMTAFPVSRKLNDPDNRIGNKSLNISGSEMNSLSGHIEFEKKLKDLVNNDSEFATKNYTEEYYYNSKDIIRKNKYIRFCYTVFLYGLIASLIAYAVAYKLSPLKF